MSFGDEVALALLAMAETLRTQTPPKFKMALKCALACNNLSLSDHLRTHCNFQLGKLYFFYTEHVDKAKELLESSYRDMCQMGDMFKESRLHALCLLVEIYILQNNGSMMLPYLKNEIQNAKPYQLIYEKMLLYYAEILTNHEENAPMALNVLEMGVNSANNVFTKVYFYLAKNLVNARLNNVNSEDATIVSQMIASLPSDNPATTNIRLFLMGTQLAFFLTKGMARSAKAILRQMQQEVQTLCAFPELPKGIVWSSNLNITILACVMTVVHSSLICSVERSVKYYGVAIKHLLEASRRNTQKPFEPELAMSLERMRMAVEETMAHVHILVCKPKSAMTNIRCMIEHSCRRPWLADECFHIIHALLGIYAVYANDNAKAERQFLAAIKNVKERHQFVLLNLHLALFYLTNCNPSAYYDIADRVSLRHCEHAGPLLRATCRIVHSFHSFLFNKQGELKQHIVDCLDSSRGEDISRMHTISLLLFSTAIPQAAQSIEQTMQWTKKSEDHSLLLWIFSLVKAERSSSGHPTSAAASAELETSIASEKKCLTDGREQAVSIMENPEHAFLEWTDGDPSHLIPRDSRIME